MERKSFLEIIDGEVTDALNLVGEQYEKGELFLPQLLKSAETTSLILKAIRPAGEEKHQKGPVVLATVKDDVHDIGKNVVKILLENYGFSVIDLGKNVDASRIADTVEKNGAKLLGLSALMTTTLPSMKETIALVKSRCPQCRIMVGGAVLTEETARLLGADFYGKDAVSSAKYAQELLGGR